MNPPSNATAVPIDTTRHERVAKQKVLAQQEFLRLRALPSLAYCSDAHLKAMSQSYMIGCSEAAMDQELALERWPESYTSQKDQILDTGKSMNSIKQAKDRMLAFLMTLPPNRRGGVLKEVLRRARVRATNSAAKAKRKAATSTFSPIDMTPLDWLAKQKVLAQQEFLRLRALPSLANCSDAHLKAMSQSYMIGCSEAEREKELALNRWPESYTAQSVQLPDKGE